MRKVGPYFGLQNFVDNGCDVGNKMAVNLIVLIADETALNFLLGGGRGFDVECASANLFGEVIGCRFQGGGIYLNSLFFQSG